MWAVARRVRVVGEEAAVALGVGIAASVIAVVSIVVAIVANRHAKAAVEKSDEANRIATESLEAQKASLPPAWSGAISTGQHAVGFTNQSSRHILVESIEIEPGEFAEMARFSRGLPIRIEYGDMLELGIWKSMGGGPEKAILVWRFEGEDEVHRSERLV